MSQPGTLRRTSLHAAHRELGARMVPFAGWEMPVQYAGVIAEHMAVRERAGLFDVSHMGQIEVRGRGAAAVLQRLTSNDVAALEDGDAQYTALLTPEAGILDDLIIYRRAADDYLAIVNAANTDGDLRWMAENVGADAEVVDRSDRFALLALQGPRAAAILAGLTDADLDRVGPFQFVEAPLAGSRALLARTGYTGEDGFEILLPSAKAPEAWGALLAAGSASGLVPVGLGARDTLRLEAGLLLHGEDMSAETTPLEAGLGFIVKLECGDFMGRDVLIRQKAEGTTRRQRGIEMMDRGIARHGHPVWLDDEVRGHVTSGSFAPYLKKNIARAYLPPRGSAPGAGVEVEVRGRRLRARVVKTPFYRRAGR